MANLAPNQPKTAIALAGCGLLCAPTTTCPWAMIAWAIHKKMLDEFLDEKLAHLATIWTQNHAIWADFGPLCMRTSA